LLFFIAGLLVGWIMAGIVVLFERKRRMNGQ